MSHQDEDNLGALMVVPRLIRKTVNAGVVKEKLLQCPHCEYRPPGKWHLQAHVKAIHDKIKDQKCPLCDFAASLPHTL